MISWGDVIALVIRDHLSSSCPDELNASMIVDLDCAEDGNDIL